MRTQNFGYKKLYIDDFFHLDGLSLFSSRCNGQTIYLSQNAEKAFTFISFPVGTVIQTFSPLSGRHEPSPQALDKTWEILESAFPND